MLRIAVVFLVSWMLVANAAPASESLPKEVAEELNFFVGNWLLKGPGDRPTSSWSFQWAPGKHCLVVEFRRVDPGAVTLGNGLLGWDSASGEFVYHGLYSDRGLEHSRSKLDAAGVLRGSYYAALQEETTEAPYELHKEVPDRFTVKIVGRDDAHFTRVKDADTRE